MGARAGCRSPRTLRMRTASLPERGRATRMADIYQDPLMQPILWQGKEYRTSHFLHRHYLSNSAHGNKYARHADYLRLLRSLETYQLYLDRADIIVLASWRRTKEHLQSLNADLASTNEFKGLHDAFIANDHKTLYLVNATIQAALYHHLDDEVSKKSSVAANTAMTRQMLHAAPPPALTFEAAIQAIAQGHVRLAADISTLQDSAHAHEKAIQALGQKCAQLEGELEGMRQAPQS